MAVAVKGTANTSTTTSVTIPTHAIGDLIVLVAYKTSITAPTKPSASGTVPAWVTIDTSSGNSNSFLSSYFVATATNHTSGTWTGATSMVAIVLTGQSPAVLGGHAGGTNTSSLTVTGHTITLTNADGSSAVLDFWARTATVTAWNAVSGFTDQATTTGTSALALSTDNDTTSVAATGRVSTGTATTGANDQFEIVSGPHPTDSIATSESLGVTNAPILYDPIDSTDTVALQCPSPLAVSSSSTVSESVSVAIVAAGGPLTVNVSDSASTTDTPALQCPSPKSVSDSSSISESVTLRCPSPINVSDSSSVSESVTVAPPSSTPQVTVSDSAGVAEWVVIAADPPIVFTLEVAVSDSASTAETTGRTLVSFVNVTDSASTTEQTTETQVSFIRVSDSASTSENINIVEPAAGSLTVSVSDSSAVTDTPALQCPSPIGVSDSATTSESVKAALLIGNINVSDTAATADTPSLQCPSPLSVSDNVSTTDTASGALVSFIRVSDTSSVTESVSVVLPAIGTLNVNVADAIGHTEATNLAGIVYTPAVSDSTSTLESFAVVLLPGGTPPDTHPPLGGLPNFGSSGGSVKNLTRGGNVVIPLDGGAKP